MKKKQKTNKTWLFEQDPNVEWQINITNFQGLFLYLYSSLKDKSIDIWSIDINELAKEFKKFIETIYGKTENLEFLSHNLMLLTELLELKTIKLNAIPKPLLSKRKLINWQNIEFLRTEHKIIAYTFKEFLKNVTIQELLILKNNMFQDLLKNKPNDLESILKGVKKAFEGSAKKIPIKKIKIQRTNINVKNGIKFLLELLKEFDVFLMLERSKNKVELVTNFLASLELARNQQVELVQQELFGEIQILKKNYE